MIQNRYGNKRDQKLFYMKKKTFLQQYSKIAHFLPTHYARWRHNYSYVSKFVILTVKIAQKPFKIMYIFHDINSFSG